MVTTDYVNKEAAVLYLSQKYALPLSVGAFESMPMTISKPFFPKNNQKEQPLMKSNKGKIEVNDPSIAPIMLNMSKKVGSVMIGKGHVMEYYSQDEQIPGMPPNLTAQYEFLKVRIDEPIFGNSSVLTTKIQIAYSSSKNMYDIYRRNHVGICLPVIRWRGESVCAWFRQKEDLLPLESMLNMQNIPKDAKLTQQIY